MRYLVIPKNRRATSLNIASLRLDPENRMIQCKALGERRRREESESITGIWLKEASGELKIVASVENHTPVTGITVIDTSPEVAARAKIELMDDAEVIPDYPIDLIPPERVAGTLTADTKSLDLWHLDAIGLIAARKKPGFTLTGEGVAVAVLDTGVENVPEIAGKVSAAYELDVGNWSMTAISPTRDTGGHGTHVSGLICGDTVGIAPGAVVHNVIMIPDGSGTLSNFVLAMEWVAAQPEISIMNMSAGIRGFTGGMDSVLEGMIAAGVFPVMAIGNEGRNKTRSPGNYRDPFSIGASDRNDRIASFSGGGTMIVDNQMYDVPDVVAPGAEVTSCVMGGGYEAWNGTSMATPIVSGLAALILEADPMISLSDLSTKIINNAKNLGFPSTRQGAGLVQVT